MTTPPQMLARPLAERVAELLPPRDELHLESDIPAAVLDAASAALRRGETHYTDRPGILELRQLIAERLNATYHIGLTARDITITCGSTEARFVALKLLARPGTKVVNMTGDVGRAFAPISMITHLIGAIHTLSLPFPGEPGILYATPTARFELYGDWLKSAADNGWWVIWDTTPTDAPRGFHPAQHANLSPRVVTLGGLHRVMPGWRIGWLAGSVAAERLRALKQSMTICTTAVSQWTALAMLKEAAE